MDKYHVIGNTSEEIKAYKATEDTTIKTAYGPVLVTEGNYIVTNADGTQVGMAEADLKANYRKVRAIKKKSK